MWAPPASPRLFCLSDDLLCQLLTQEDILDPSDLLSLSRVSKEGYYAIKARLFDRVSEQARSVLGLTPHRNTGPELTC